MTDIKRVLAYSTISQLGYMMLALGVGGTSRRSSTCSRTRSSRRCSSSAPARVNHATDTFDMRKMGGLRKYMPITYATFAHRLR